MRKKLDFSNPLDSITGHVEHLSSFSPCEDVADNLPGTFTWKEKSDYAQLRADDDSMRISCVALSPDGGSLATGSADGTFTLWRLRDFVPVRTYAAESRITALAFAPNGQDLTIGCKAKRVVNLLDMDVVKKYIPYVVDVGLGAVTAVAYNAKGDHIAVVTAEEDGLYIFCACKHGFDLLYKTARPARVTAVTWCLSSSGLEQCRTVEGNYVFSWTIGRLSTSAPGQLRGREGTISAYVRHPAGYTVLGTSQGRLWVHHHPVSREDTPDSKSHAGVEYSTRVSTLACSANGKHVAAGFDSGHIRVFDAQELDTLAEYRFAKATVSHLAIANADNVHRVVCLYADGTVCLKDIRHFRSKSMSSLSAKLGL